MAKIKFGVIGLNHDHIYMQVDCLLAAGGELVSFHAVEDALASAFARAYPSARRVADRRAILEDESLSLVLTAAIPSSRTEIAVAAMRHGKDVMSDKPVAVSLEQLAELRRVQADTGQILSVYYEGRLENRATTLACNLVRSGAIGRLVHFTSLAPHAIRKDEREPWFFRPADQGGIIADLATHSVDQFLYLAETIDADVSFARVANRANPDIPAFQDIGEVCLTAPSSSAYVRLDWLTPQGLPVYGDCRMFIVGTEGSIEVRQCIDLNRDGGSETVFLVDRKGIRRMDCEAVDLPYGRQLVADVLHRTDTAMTQEHCFKATELVLRAQALANSSLSTQAI
jgi:predicted dehydrogenase